MKGLDLIYYNIYFLNDDVEVLVRDRAHTILRGSSTHKTLNGVSNPNGSTALPLWGPP